MLKKTLLAVVLAMAVAQSASAQNTVRILVGFPPGGSADTTARAIADKMKDILGSNFGCEWTSTARVNGG